MQTLHTNLCGVSSLSRHIPGILGITALVAVTASACTTSEKGDALARLKPEPGPTITLPAAELFNADAQAFLIVCPGVPASEVVDSVGGNVDVPDEGFDSVLNAFVMPTSDGGVITQQYATEEIDLCSEGFPDPLTQRKTSTPLTFVKERTQWKLVAN